MPAASKWPPRVTVELHRGYGDCEDCGMYDYAQVTFSVEGREPLSAGYDGHLGGGTWGGDVTSVCLWVLALLGYRLRHNGQDIDTPAFHVNNYDAGYRQWQQVPLFEGEVSGLTPLDITVEQVNDPASDMDGEVRAVELAPFGYRSEPMRFEMRYEADGYTPTADSWQGGWDEVYKRLLESVCELKWVETQDEDEHTDDDDGDDV